jgi:hypothetical protein
VIVSTTGPRMSPEGPNHMRPPTTEMKARTVCCFSRFPTSTGRSRLSMVPTTSIPQSVSTSALPQLPSMARKSAAGIHTTKAPSTGTTASKAMTTPQSRAPGRPSHQNMSPPSTPCTVDTARVP